MSCGCIGSGRRGGGRGGGDESQVAVIHGIDGGDDLGDACVDDHSSLDHLLQCDLEHLPMEHQVQLADVFEAAVQHLDKHLDQVQDSQLALILVHNEDEVEGCVMPVDDSDVAGIQIVPLFQNGRHRQKRRLLLVSLSNELMHL